MRQTTVVYERGTGGPIEELVVHGGFRIEDEGIELEAEIPERRVPIRTMTVWIPMHRIICIETREV